MALIVVAGMKRSGTTWLFNVVRLALPGYQTSHDYSDIPAGDVILKSHWWRESVARRASLVFSSERDLCEVSLSLERVTGQRYTGRQMAKLVEHWRLWDQIANYRMDYQQLVSDPVSVAAEVLAILDSDADPVSIVEQVAVLEPPAEGIDPVTFYLPEHFA